MTGTKPTALSYEFVPTRVEWVRDGAAVSATVPIAVPNRMRAVWLLGWQWGNVPICGVIGGALFDGVKHSIHGRGCRVAAVAAVIVTTSCAMAAVVGATKLWVIHPARVERDGNDLVVTDLRTRRVRRWSDRVEVVEVSRLGRSLLGRLRVRFTTGEQVDIGLAAAADLAPVAAELNASVASSGK